MAFSKEEIIRFENPYEKFQNGDALAENVSVLDALTTEEKNALATKIITACPGAVFKQYGRHIEALRHMAKSEETFYSVITEAYQVRQRIFALLDPRNESPHTLFGDEFNPAPFHRFSELVAQTLKSNESAIAERLALCTPAETRSRIAHNLDIAFPKHALSSRTQVAFILRHNVDKLLLGNKPEQFFTSQDFDIDTCKMFPNMFRALLKGHEEEIGTTLSSIASIETRAEIKRKLALLHTELFDDANPFKLITDAMLTKESALQKKSLAQSTSPQGFFATPHAQQLSTKKQVEDSDEEDYESDVLFSLFGDKF